MGLHSSLTKPTQSFKHRMKKILLIVLGAVVLVGATGAVSYFLLVDKSPAEQVEQGVKGNEAEKQEENRPKIYHELHPNFVVNFQNPNKAQFLQVSVQVMARSEDTIDATKQHMPAIRNSLVMLFSSQDAQGLRSREGKEKLREDVLAEVRKVLEEQTGEPGVEQVYFTSFVMQ